MSDERKIPWPTKSEVYAAVSGAKTLARLMRASGISPVTMAVLAVGTLKIFREDGHGAWIDALMAVDADGDEEALRKVFDMFRDDE